MTWQNRIRQAAYKTESGKRFEFEHEDVSRSTDKRTSAFSFPGVNNDYVQDNGYGSRQYAMNCIFWGDDCDINASRFEAALLEPGVGVLEHPIYGTFDVVPFGRIQRKDSLRSAANQAVVTVTFWTTVDVLYPNAARSQQNEVNIWAAGYGDAGVESFSTTMKLDKPTEQANLRGTVEAAIAKADEALSKPGKTTAAYMAEFNAWQQTINYGLSTLVGNPVLLAEQLINMITAPARAIVGIQNAIVAYANYLELVFTSVPGQPWVQSCACASPRRQTTIANDWFTADLEALTGLVAMAIAAAEAEYASKPEALSVAEYLLAQYEAVSAWRDRGYATLADAGYGARIENLDSGLSLRYAHETVMSCVGYLVDISFSLSPERVHVTDRPRTVVDLCAELYGTVDSKLDFLINSNGLTGSEILELPRGSEIVWYP